jgi:hypothetical protein
MVASSNGGSAPSWLDAVTGRIAMGHHGPSV